MACVSMALVLLCPLAVLGVETPLPAPVGWPVPDPSPPTPGPVYQPPIDAAMAVQQDAPRIYEHTADAGPDESFLMVGDGLTDEVFVWGRAAKSPGGSSWEAATPLVKPNYLAATLPDRSLDAPFLVWVRNQAGWSRPVRLNVPRPWWCWPKRPAAGDVLRIFGRDLARRPDHTTAFVYLAATDGKGRWLEPLGAEKYTASVRIPKETPAGKYQLWFHAGCGGRFGWGEPLEVEIAARGAAASRVVQLNPPPEQTAVDLNGPLAKLAAAGGGTLQLGAGVYPFRGTIKVPAGVTLAGAGRDATRLQLVRSRPEDFARIEPSRWNRAPGGLHTPGDTIDYKLAVPASGKWTVWLRYATEMSPWKQPGVSGKMALSLDDGPPVPLENLPNTGSFGTFRWSRSARMSIAAGTHTLRWKNVRGGGISPDAYVFALDPNWQPGDAPFPQTGDRVVVLQGEDVVRFACKDGSLPNRTDLAVWLAGDGAAMRDVTLSGNPQSSIGVAVRSEKPLRWIHGCRITSCRIADLEGKPADISAVRLFRAAEAVVTNNELWGRCPIYLSGVRNGNFSHNRLVPVTRFGGNSEAAIQGRNEVIEQCIVEHNVVASPPGAEAGGPQTRRLIWVSTGRGSITRNWFAANGVERARQPGATLGAGPMRFGGVAGTEQNVGEMILFEGNHRTMYFGPLAAADRQSVTLPEVVPPTPDERLGSMSRERLAHNAKGEETPFWPPEAEDDSDEPPMGEYYVSVFQGPGQGQTRRVVARRGARLLLDRPWRVPPAKGSVVAVGTGFYQNLIVGNHTPDGMTGIQLWISCMENVVAANSIARMRKPALFLYANGTTLASSMPRTWNRGISPLFFNYVEGNRAEQCSAGALITSGDYPDVPVEFPRALGNVLRHNSFIASRGDGVVLTSRKGTPEAGDTAPSILGTIVEFNVVRDARCGYHSGAGNDGALFRRNHAYFWYPVDHSLQPPVAFRVDRPKADVVMKENTIEGTTGVPNAKQIVPLRTPDERQ